MKKYLKLFVLCGCFLFTALIFATMAGAGITAVLFGTRVNGTVYACIKDGSAVSIIALILVILGLLAIGFAAVVELLKIKFAFGKIVLLCAGLLLFVACILFFLTSVPYDGYSVGVGAIFSAIFALFASCGCCYAGLVLSK